jgi:hypothetical protein
MIVADVANNCASVINGLYMCITAGCWLLGLVNFLSAIKGVVHISGDRADRSIKENEKIRWRNVLVFGGIGLIFMMFTDFTPIINSTLFQGQGQSVMQITM